MKATTLRALADAFRSAPEALFGADPSLDAKFSIPVTLPLREWKRFDALDSDFSDPLGVLRKVSA